MFGRSKGNYLIVCHAHWMGHLKWHQEFLTDVTKKEADGAASILADKHRGDFSDATGTAFLLPDTVLVQKT